MSDLFQSVILAGRADDIRRAQEAFSRQPVDWDLAGEPPDPPDRRRLTLSRPAVIDGPGTFRRRERHTVLFEPTDEPGWRFERQDLPGGVPIAVAVNNVWTTVRNIVLRTGSPHNYMRMVEHIIALRLGLGLDNLVIKVFSGDPPLFDRGSLDLVEALDAAGRRPTADPVAYVTVKEPVTMGGPNGSFLTLLPAAPGACHLRLDCAVDFPNAMGRQRVRFVLTRSRFRYGAVARTNTTAFTKCYARTVGKLFADIRNLGYTDRNILIAGRRRYLNAPQLFHDGKSLEAVWHRALLDLLAALALIEQGRFVGTAVSYKAGHTLDVELVRVLPRYGLLRVLPVDAAPEG